MENVEFSVSRTSVYIVKYRRESSLHPNFSTLETDRPQHDHLTAGVIAQHYSSASSVSMHFCSRKEKLSARFTNVILIFYPFKKIA
jgi:hypothetical protein